MSADELTDDLHGVAERRLRRIDQRYTSGRRAIVELLLSAGHPVSISDIAERLPELPRSSAYRHLTDLQAAGLIRRVAAMRRCSTTSMWTTSMTGTGTLPMAITTTSTRAAAPVLSWRQRKKDVG